MSYRELWLTINIGLLAILTVIALAMRDLSLLTNVGLPLVAAAFGSLLWGGPWGAVGYFMRLNKTDKLSIQGANGAAAYYNRGNVHDAKGDNESAIADYNQALNLNPKYVDALIGRGLTLSRTGDYEKAIADFSQAISLDPKCARAYYYRGRLYGGLGDYRSAIADFDHSIRFDPNDNKAHSARRLAERKLSKTPSGINPGKARHP